MRIPYFANAYLTMYEALLSLLQVCVHFVFPNVIKAKETIVCGHIACLFLEVYMVLLNFEFSPDGNCLQYLRQPAFLDLCQS